VPATRGGELDARRRPYDRIIDQGFAGWIGDVRIVDRPLPTTAFLTAP
jgi:hypothetical protein